MKKTKIELFEEKLIEEGLTDDKLKEYEKLLKRSRDDWNRIQHCAFTAYKFPIERINKSEKLIKFGINKYGSNKECVIYAYTTLGAIYERTGYYQKAYEIYVLIFPNIKCFRENFPWCLLNMKMHIDNFKYSEELERYYELCLAENDFSKAFLNHMFTLVLAEYIIADYYGNSEDKSKAYDTICEMIEPGYKGALYKCLKKHKYEERLKITKEGIAFLDRISR